MLHLQSLIVYTFISSSQKHLSDFIALRAKSEYESRKSFWQFVQNICEQRDKIISQKTCIKQQNG